MGKWMVGRVREGEGLTSNGCRGKGGRCRGRDTLKSRKGRLLSKAGDNERKGRKKKQERRAERGECT